MGLDSKNAYCAYKHFRLAIAVTRSTIAKKGFSAKIRVICSKFAIYDGSSGYVISIAISKNRFADLCFISAFAVTYNYNYVNLFSCVFVSLLEPRRELSRLQEAFTCIW